MTEVSAPSSRDSFKCCQESEEEMKPGLYSNIAAKKKRIAEGSGEKMRKPGTKGAPTKADFKDAAKTAKKGKK